MKRFAYLRDPLFLASCLLYALNRWLLKPHLAWPILQNWFNDTLLIPCALPPLLLAYRWLRLRDHDQPPTNLEVFGILIGWSLLFEWAGPRFIRRATGDFLDVIAYAAGALFAITWWQWRYRRAHEL